MVVYRAYIVVYRTLHHRRGTSHRPRRTKSCCEIVAQIAPTRPAQYRRWRVFLPASEESRSLLAHAPAPDTPKATLQVVRPFFSFGSQSFACSFHSAELRRKTDMCQPFAFYFHSAELRLKTDVHFWIKLLKKKRVSAPFF